MRLADERHHVMLAGRIQFDVLDQDHLLVLFLEHRTPEDFRSVLLVSVCQELQSLRHSLRSLYKSFALRVFAQQLEYFLIVCRYGSSCRFVVALVFCIGHFIWFLCQKDAFFRGGMVLAPWHHREIHINFVQK